MNINQKHYQKTNTFLFDILDPSKIVVGSIFGLVALCVISIAIVFAVYKKRKMGALDQTPTFDNPLSREAAATDVEQQNTQL